MSIRTRKLKSGRTAYDVELRRPDGTKYGRRFYVKQQAKDWQAEQIADRARDTWADPVAGRIRLRDYAQEWLENRELAPRSREVYDSQLKHILAAFGDHSLNAITKRAVRGWNTKMRREVSPLQAAKCYRLLMAMLNTAVEDDVIGKNRCRIKGAAQERSAERPLVPLDKAIELAATIDRRYRALVLLAAGCGLRLGELLALTRADVDLVHGTLRVDKQKQELSKGQGIVVRPPKTEAGKRPVNIPTIIVGELEEHLREFVGAAPDATLFLGPRGGQRRARVYEEWHKAVTAAGLRLT